METILLLLVGGIVGYFIGFAKGGKDTKASYYWDKFLEHDLNEIKPPEYQRLFFTKKERYEYGKAFVLKKGIKEATEKLRYALGTIIGLELESLEKKRIDKE